MFTRTRLFLSQIDPIYTLTHHVFNIMLPSTSLFSKWFFLFGISDWSCVRISYISSTCPLPGGKLMSTLQVHAASLISTAVRTSDVTFSLCSSVNVRDQILHPYKTTAKRCSFICLNLYVFNHFAFILAPTSRSIKFKIKVRDNEVLTDILIMIIAFILDLPVLCMHNFCVVMLLVCVACRCGRNTFA
jgi:hypothetical protein